MYLNSVDNGKRDLPSWYLKAKVCEEKICTRNRAQEKAEKGMVRPFAKKYQEECAGWRKGKRRHFDGAEESRNENCRQGE
ncbi:MAG TPA: hypothetical protein DEP42_00185 [Ruminococcaceae bacterium]|nr:hypothetical protein [Oscillospiraceae bacterium]